MGTKEKVKLVEQEASSNGPPTTAASANYEKKRTPNQGCPRSPTSMSSEETHSMGGLKMHRSTTKGKDYGSTLWQNQAN